MKRNLIHNLVLTKSIRGVGGRFLMDSSLCLIMLLATGKERASTGFDCRDQELDRLILWKDKRTNSCTCITVQPPDVMSQYTKKGQRPSGEMAYTPSVRVPLLYISSQSETLTLEILIGFNCLHKQRV